MNKQRLNSTELDQISTLILSGFSLKTIANKLNKSKTTIYYHYLKIYGKKIIKPQTDSLGEDFLGEFIGLFVGDGYIYHDKKRFYYSIRFFFNKKETAAKI